MQVLVVLPVHSVYAVQAVNAFHPLDADGCRWFCWIDRRGAKSHSVLDLMANRKKSGSFDLVSESRSDLACQ